MKPVVTENKDEIEYKHQSKLLASLEPSKYQNSKTANKMKETVLHKNPAHA